MTYVFKYQETHQYFAQVAGGMEALAEEELRELGAEDTEQQYRGIRFQADTATLYRINYAARLVSRILAPLVVFKCRHTDQLYKKARLIPWEEIFNVDQTFAIYANVSNSPIRHSKYAALRVKDGIVDRFRTLGDSRPSIDTRNPDIWISLHIDEELTTISIDTSHGPLHKRGYRQKSVAAPMQETLAAAIVRLSGWNGETALVDPMCGSGTILAEALMHYTRTPAGYLREKFGFVNLPDFNPALWQSVKTEQDQLIRELPDRLIVGSDISPTAVAATRDNLSLLPHGNFVSVAQKNLFQIDRISDKTIITNPPYGIRMGKTENMSDFYRKLGDFLKQRCHGSTAYIYFGERQYLKDIGLRTSWKKPLVNGALDGRLAKIELYQGVKDFLKNEKG